MPTVLRQNGFEIKIFLPRREHGPAHVHVYKSGTRAVINLPDGDQPFGVGRVGDMRDVDVAMALIIVKANLNQLLAAWRSHHGSKDAEHG